MTVYTFPDITPTSQTFELVTNTKTFQSPLSNAIQTVSRKGSYWKTSMTFSNLTDDDRGILQGFISKLDGQTHRMRIRDYGQPFRGNAPSGDSATIYDARSGDYIVLDDVTPSIGDYLKAGDYISFNNELHIVTQDALSNSAGRAGVYIAPPVRKAPTTAGDSVLVRNATGVFMMTNNPQWRTQAPYISTITIEAVEDVLA